MGFKKFLAVASLAILSLLWYAIPAYAIANPDSILFGSETDTNMYQAFQNVSETGDMLFVAETFVSYNVTPTDYKSNEAFSLELLDTDGTTVLYSTPVLSGASNTAFEAYVNSIYLTATQASSLTWESAYSIRLTGNPAIFGSPVEGTNKRTHVLEVSDYITDSPAGTSLVGLRLFVISIATNLQTHDSPASDYIIEVQGVAYLTTTGGNIFLDGIPGLNVFVLDVFQTTAGVIQLDPLSPTGTYAETLNPAAKLGPVIADGITNFGVWMGMGTTMAGGVILLLMTLVLCGYAYVKTKRFLVPDAIAIAMPLLGIYLGLLPLAIGFTIAIGVTLVSGYYFFTRGVL